MADLKQTLTGLVRAIVDHPEDVVVTVDESSSSIDLVLTVNPDDMGMVIGRHGKIAKAIRTVIKAAAAGSGKKVNVEIR